MKKRPWLPDEGKGHDEDEHAKAKAKPINFAREVALYPKGSWVKRENRHMQFCVALRRGSWKKRSSHVYCCPL